MVLKERAYQTAANELERDIAHFEAFVSDALLRLPVRYSLEEVPRNSSGLPQKSFRGAFRCHIKERAT